MTWSGRPDYTARVTGDRRLWFVEILDRGRVVCRRQCETLTGARRTAVQRLRALGVARPVVET